MDKDSCPSWFAGRAQTEWQRVVAALSKVPGLLTSCDRTVLISYCENYARWRDAEARLEEEGRTVTIKQEGVSVEHPSPWVKISKLYHASMMKAALELGITPFVGTDMDLSLFFSQPTLQDMFDQAAEEVKQFRAREEARAVKELLSSEEYVLEDQRGVLGLLASIPWILKPIEMEILLDYCRTWNRYQEAQRTGAA